MIIADLLGENPHRVSGSLEPTLPTAVDVDEPTLVDGESDN